MEGCSKTTAGAGVAGLPDDPVLEILSQAQRDALASAGDKASA